MASKRGLRRRQCGSKKKLAKAEAIDTAWRMGKQKLGQSFDAYECKLCGGGVWHVGHRTGKNQQRISARQQLTRRRA